MQIHRRGLGVVAVAGLVSACADGSIAGPDPAGMAPRAPSFTVAATAPACETITFDAFKAGQPITAVSVLGLNLGVTTVAYASNTGAPNPNGAVAFQTDGLNDNPAGSGSVVVEDDDLQWRGEDSPYDADLAGGECPGCATLGRILVVQDSRPFVPWGDSEWGGQVTFANGFSSGAYEYYIESFTAVDVDLNSPGVRLLVDGVQVAQAANLGNGSVQTVSVATVQPITSSFAFRFGTPEADNILGSGGVDNVRICRRAREVVGREGCTLGYWKQSHHFDSWVRYTPSQRLNTVFDFNGGAAAVASLGGDTFLAALNYNGGSGLLAAARLLLKQAVPALLNAASPDVDYALTTSQIVAQVNAALDSGSRDTILALAAQLDRYNNAGCPLN